jgi:peptidoglycan/LPS O-acetylase OafA/YrhL
MLANPAKTSPPKWLATIGGRNTVLFIGMSACCVLVYAKTFLAGTITVHETWTMFRWGAFSFILYTLPFGLIIVSLAAGPTFLSRVLEHPFIVLLGEASYSLYILHIGTWSLVAHLQHAGVFPGSWFPALALLATIAISIFCFKYIEMPARSKLRSAFEHRFGLPRARSMVTALGSRKISTQAT